MNSEYSNLENMSKNPEGGLHSCVSVSLWKFIDIVEEHKKTQNVLGCSIVQHPV